jgi:arsenate reductase-like glutaredoxin family protein
MTSSENREQLELQVIEYLYGGMSDEELAHFDQRLESDSALRQLLEQEQRLQSALPIGSQPRIDEERLQGNRWMLRQRLQKSQRARSLASLLAVLRQRPLTVALQGAAMAMTFLLGIMVASPQSGSGPVAGNEQVGLPLPSQATSPLAFIDDEDYEIFQLRVNSYDAASGDIDLSFSLASETRLTGNVADAGVHRLMAAALQDDIDSASRLDTIEVLQAVRAGEEVNQALIHVLLNDQNPGVRYQAVQALVELSDQEAVRAALRYALQSDVNQGVRVEAFNALSDYRDPQTLQVFRQQMEDDSNEYIRSQARSIVEAQNTSEQDDLIY